jgi:hypothetical protein
VAGFPPALTAVRALGGGALASGKASTGAAGLGEPPGAVALAWGAPERCGEDGVRKLGFLLLQPKSAKQALYIGSFVQRSPIRVGIYLQVI